MSKSILGGLLAVVTFVVMMLVAWALPDSASAQVLPQGAPASQKCAVVNVALEQLTGAPTTTSSLPALATLQAATPASYTDTVVPGRGYEISAGTISGETRFGATFVGDVDGGLPGVFFSSVNYAPPSPGLGVANYVVGGEWALCGSWGALYGSFTDGVVQWNADGSLADVGTDMSVLGGTVNGVPVSGGSGSFGGVLDHTPLAQGLPPTIGGTLQLQVSGASGGVGAELPETGGFPFALPVGALLVCSGVGASLLLRSLLRTRTS
jgi:hypothetical protein